MADSGDTIGENPLDSIIPPDDKDTEDIQSEETTGTSSGGTDRSSGEKKRMTVHISEDLAERIKNAVYWTPGLTVSEVAEKGLTWVIEQLEEENEGPFEERDQELKGGRPVK